MTIARFAVASAIALPLLWSTAVFAQEEEGRDEETAIIEEERDETLADRIPSVTRRTFRKAGRLQIAPTLGLSLNDPFYDHIMLGAGLHYHIGESLAVGASGYYSLALESTIGVGGGTGEFSTEFDRAAYGGFLELSWAPFYGKLSLLAESVLHFDTFITVGGGVVGLDQGDPAIAGTVAIGQHYFMNDWLALRIELRDQIFSMARTAEVDPDDTSLQNLVTFTIGLAFYVPGEFEREEL
ncbi:MAG: outer membrane beta-barrel domain-containing protein [Myxococcota bacterium]